MRQSAKKVEAAENNSDPSAAWALVTDYYDLRLEFSGIKRPKWSQKNALAYASSYLTWAEAEGVNPRLFMRYLFQVYRHSGHIPFLSGMRAKKLLPAWRKRGEGAALEQERFRKHVKVARTKMERDVAKLRAKPTKIQEVARTDYAKCRRYSLCMLDPSAGGYDPRSKVCPSCPNKYECLIGTNRKYGFDVGALRVGLLSRLPPEVISSIKK